jgi:hypothetical protein
MVSLYQRVMARGLMRLLARCRLERAAQLLGAGTTRVETAPWRDGAEARHTRLWLGVKP